MAELPFPRENITQRAKILERAKIDTEFRNAVYTRASRDLVFFVNTFGFTYDPRPQNYKNLPFLLFPRQEEYLRWRIDVIERKDHGLIEKSRDMGVSWLNVSHHVWAWLFQPGFKGTFGSRKKEYVDVLNNLDSLLEKARYMIRRLPTWMQPEGASLNYLKIFNPEIGSLITGEIGSDTGRGGRSSIYDADEFAFLQNAEAADSGISQNADSAFYTSTPNGNDNLYYLKRFSKKIPVFTFNYYDHPAKDKAWLDEQKRKLDPIVVAREILIDYEGSAEGVVIPSDWVRAAVNLRLTAGGIRAAALDVAEGGTDSNCYTFRIGPTILKCTKWRQQTTSQTAHQANLYCQEDKADQFAYDANAIGAGVTGVMANLLKEGKVDYRIVPVKNSFAATENTYPKLNNRIGKEIFANLRAELHWNLRMRFERTYEHVNNLNFYEESELISIPDIPDLIQNLSKQKFFFNNSGLIQLEPKDKMMISPDEADSLSMLFPPGEVIERQAWWM